MSRMRTGMACRQRTVERALRKMHFSYRKRRPAPHNSASEEEQERFKAETNARLEGLRKDGYAVFAEDEGTLQLSPANGYGWRPTNGHDTVPTSFSKKSVKVFCAVGENELSVRPAGAANSDEFADALKELHGKHPKFVMVPDNASYHKSHTVRKYLEAIVTAIAIRSPPPLSIGILRVFIRQDATVFRNFANGERIAMAETTHNF